MSARISTDESTSVAGSASRLYQNYSSGNGLIRPKSSPPDGAFTPLRKQEALAVAKKILERLDGAPPRRSAGADKFKEIRSFLSKNGPDSSSAVMTAHDAATLYEFFKRAESVLDPRMGLDITRTREIEFPGGRELCRALKWQFRMCLNSHVKARLDQQLEHRLGYVQDGGERLNEVLIRPTFGLDPAGSIAGYFQLGLSNNLSSTPAREIKDSTKLAFEIGGEAAFTKWCAVNLGIGYGATHTKKYASLHEYVGANSSSLSAWFNESKMAAFENIGDIIKLSKTYEKDILYCAFSRPRVEQGIRELGLAGIALQSNSNIGSSDYEDTISSSKIINGGVNFSGFGSAVANFEGVVEGFVKNKKLDIIDLMDLHPELAKEKIKEVKGEASGEKIIDKINAHVDQGSRRVFFEISRNATPAEIRGAIQKSRSDSKIILEQYVAARLSGKIDSEMDLKIRRTMDDHKIIFRPASLKEHVLQTHGERRVVSLNIGVATAGLAPATGSIKSSLQLVKKDDDPHAVGQYLELEISGTFATMDALETAVRASLQRVTTSSNDIGAVAGAVGGVAFHQSHGMSTKALVKLKDNKPILMVAQTFLVKKDKTDLKVPVSTGGSVDGGISAEYKTLGKECLGTESLDFILQIARKKLSDPVDKNSWDAYVESHESDFDEIIKKIGRRDKKSILYRELLSIGENSPGASSLIEKLSEAASLADATPTPTNRSEARTKLTDVLTKYVQTYYRAEVAKSWTLT
ncbi:hypothetical protein [Burkholderia ubonensis]|uniref:hypothetical protein n=1 Tax=Burkholderia ubonensis TaxID=101571 RepID=UPI0012F7AADD|nr:hypothetical protein [Burkholderia ubonensis]